MRLQREQARRFAGLARRMKDKIFFLFDQTQNVIEIEPMERRQTIMILGLHRPGGIKKAWHALFLLLFEFVFFQFAIQGFAVNP